MHLVRRLLPIWLVGLALASTAEARTFYVAPGSGCSDSNPGTMAAPWCTPPGTRTAAGNAPLHAAWGSITTSARITCGDVILLRGGATQTSAQGGAWTLSAGSAGFYAGNCTGADGTRPEGRITLRVATSAEWPASSGAFTIQTNGMASAGGELFFRQNAFVLIDGVNAMTVGGVSAAQRLRVIGPTPLGDMSGQCNG